MNKRNLNKSNETQRIAYACFLGITLVFIPNLKRTSMKTKTKTKRGREGVVIVITFESNFHGRLDTWTDRDLLR
jgi:hypothetical protein